MVMWNQAFYKRYKTISGAKRNFETWVARNNVQPSAEVYHIYQDTDGRYYSGPASMHNSLRHIVATYQNGAWQN